MSVNTSTTDKAIIACDSFIQADREFWYIAAHYGCDDPKSIEAEKRLRRCANVLMQSLLSLVQEE